MKKWLTLTTVLGALVFASSAEAALLKAGDKNVAVDVMSAATFTTLTTGGTKLGEIIHASVKTGAWEAVASTQVYKNAGGFIDFVYTVTNKGPEPLEDLNMFNFGDTGDVEVFVLDGTSSPNNAYRSKTGSSIGFQYNDEVDGFDYIGTGATTTVIIRTHAGWFGPGTFSIADGEAATVAGFAPVSAPLPSSLVLFGTGALGFFGTWMRRLRKKQVLMA